jgi:hypothetical protein
MWRRWFRGMLSFPRSSLQMRGNEKGRVGNRVAEDQKAKDASTARLHEAGEVVETWTVTEQSRAKV